MRPVLEDSKPQSLQRVKWLLRSAKAWAVLTGAVVLASAAGWPLAKTHLQAVAVLRQVAGQPVPWVVRSVTSSVTKEDVTFAVEEPAGLQTVRARMYTPANARNAPAMVVLHGVHHLGIDEPRLMGFAEALAGCGIRVLTPELPGIKDYRVGEESVRTIGESVEWFAARTGAPVGVMGLSFSGGLALVAAAEPRYHPAFRFVFAVGSQDSMDRVAGYYRTGSDLRPDGTVEELPAHEYGPLVLEYEYLEDFVPNGDLVPVKAVLRAHLYEDKQAEADASLALNPAQKREALGLLDSASAETRARIAELIAKHTEEMGRLSPRGRLKKLDTPVYLLHGEADNVIPAAETLWLASELPREELQAVLVSPVLSHVDIGASGPNAWDEWRLIHFLAGVLRAAEADTR